MTMLPCGDYWRKALLAILLLVVDARCDWLSTSQMNCQKYSRMLGLRGGFGVIGISGSNNVGRNPSNGNLQNQALASGAGTPTGDGRSPMSRTPATMPYAHLPDNEMYLLLIVREHVRTGDNTSAK